MRPRIFIGGTGRSGTGIVYKALGCHENIHSFPKEMRFLVDPDGLVTLIDALSTNYSPVIAREVLFRFERLMREYLTSPHQIPYRGFDLVNWLGSDTYRRRLDAFCAELVEVEYEGIAWQVAANGEGRLVDWVRNLQELRARWQGRPDPTPPSLSREQLRFPRYFPTREDLVRLAAAFVDDLFLYAAQQRGKETWCEKTPQNIFHLDFLWELFPEATIVHVKRDPRGVVHSMTKQSWKRAPNDVRNVCLLLRNLYSRWLDVRNRMDVDQHRYLEMKIEEIARSPREQLERIVSFAGIDGSFGPLPEITLERVDYWRQTMPAEEQAVVNDLLGPYIEEMGYDPAPVRR